MTVYIKEPHTTIFTDTTGCGKTHLVFDLIQKEYNKYFYYIISSAQHFDGISHIARTGSKMMIKVWLVEPKGKLYHWIEELSQLQHTQTHYLSSMISSLMKALGRGGNP